MSVSLELTGTPATIRLTLAATHVSGGSQASIAFDGVALRVPYKVERPLAVRVHQISAVVGRGHPGSALV